jgi:hypothetical protein
MPDLKPSLACLDNLFGGFDYLIFGYRSSNYPFWRKYRAFGFLLHDFSFAHVRLPNLGVIGDGDINETVLVEFNVAEDAQDSLRCFRYWCGHIVFRL